MIDVKLCIMTVAVVTCFTMLVPSKCQCPRQAEVESREVPPQFEREKHSPGNNKENLNNEIDKYPVGYPRIRRNIKLNIMEDEKTKRNDEGALDDEDSFQDKFATRDGKTGLERSARGKKDEKTRAKMLSFFRYGRMLE